MRIVYISITRRSHLQTNNVQNYCTESSINRDKREREREREGGGGRGASHINRRQRRVNREACLRYFGYEILALFFKGYMDIGDCYLGVFDFFSRYT